MSNNSSSNNEVPNTNEEDAMKNTPGYQEALNLLEGNPFTTWVTPVSGNYMIETCDHDFCNEATHEAGAEVNMLKEICCGESPCDHWNVWLCDQHTNKKEGVMNKYNWTNTQCDWCEENKDCRGLEDHPGNVVLVICEDCDTNKNTNQKENTMNINLNTIQAIAASIDFDLLQQELTGDKFKLGQCYMVTKVATDPLDTSKPGFVFVGSDYYGHLTSISRNDGACYVIKGDRDIEAGVKVIPVDIIKNILPDMCPCEGVGPCNNCRPEVTTNNKEINMNTNQKCQAIVMDENNLPRTCKCKGKKVVQVLVKGDMIQTYDVRVHNNMPNWRMGEAVLCNTHVKTLVKKSIKAFVENKLVLEKVEEDAELVDILTKPYTTNCPHCEDGTHNTMQQWKKCMLKGKTVVKATPHHIKEGFVKAPAQAVRFSCGNCRKNGEDDPTHDTAADVKTCYMNRYSKEGK